MPRVRRRANYHQLSDFERGRIIGLHEAGIGFREIARRMQRNIATIIRCWRSWSEDNRQHRREGSGRPRMTTNREDRRLRLLALRNRHSTSRSIGNIFLGEIGHRITMRTIYRRIRSYGLTSYRPRLILPLTNRHRNLRLEWCNARANWDEEWNRVVFSDESRFCLWAHDGRRRVRRRRGERRFLEFALERETALTRGLMVWGGISLGSRTPLVFLQGQLNAQRYIREVLEPIAVPYIRGLNNVLFQQDNARPHIAAVTLEFLEVSNIDILPWPARSPDLSPIEHVWDMMGRRIGLLPNPPMNLDDLRNALHNAWNELPQETIDNLIRSMPRRTAECIRLNGGATNY